MRWFALLALVACGKSTETATPETGAPTTDTSPTGDVNPALQACTAGTSWGGDRTSEIAAMVLSFDYPDCTGSRWDLAVDIWGEADEVCVRMVGGPTADEGHPFEFIVEQSTSALWQAHLDIAYDEEDLESGATTLWDCDALSTATFGFHAISGGDLTACAAWGADPSRFPDCEDASAW